MSVNLKNLPPPSKERVGKTNEVKNDKFSFKKILRRFSYTKGMS